MIDNILVKLTSNKLRSSRKREDVLVKQGLITKAEERSHEGYTQNDQPQDIQNQANLPHCGECWGVCENPLSGKGWANVVAVDDGALVVDASGGVHPWSVIILEWSDSWKIGCIKSSLWPRPREKQSIYFNIFFLLIFREKHLVYAINFQISNKVILFGIKSRFKFRLRTQSNLSLI